MDIQQASLLVGVIGGIVGILGAFFSVFWTLRQSRERVSVRLRAVLGPGGRAASFVVEAVNLGVPSVCVTFAGFRSCGRRGGGRDIIGGVAQGNGDLDADKIPLVLDHGGLCQVRVLAPAMRGAGTPVRPAVRLSTGRVFQGRRVADPSAYFEVGRRLGDADGDVLVERR